ncbi:hypothetical protein K438DRAFT_1819081, partial [Mycena galopus ATCC 62051]
AHKFKPSIRVKNPLQPYDLKHCSRDFPFLTLHTLTRGQHTPTGATIQGKREWTPSDGSSTATGRARAGPTASTRGRCGRLGIANVVSPRRSRRGWARRRVRGARRTKKELKPPAPISTSPGSASTDTLKAELPRAVGGQATRRMCAHSGEDDDVHAGRGDIRDNGRAQQRTRARPPRTATLRERRLPHRARYTAPLSVQVRPAALSACRANG